MPAPLRSSLLWLCLLGSGSLTSTVGAYAEPITAVPAPPLRPAEIDGASVSSSLGDVATAKPVPPVRPDELTAPHGAATAPTTIGPAPPTRPLDLVPADSTSPSGPSRVGERTAEPLPPERPPELTPALTLTIEPREAPLPPDRPAELETTSLEGESGNEPVPLPPERPAELSEAGREASVLAQPEDTACLARLDTLGARYERHKTIVKGQCSVPHPVSLVSLADMAGRTIRMTADQALVCDVAESLARWIRDVQVIAEKELAEPITAMAIGGYNCRGQNNVGEAKLSEHAFANAVDVMSFTFGKRSSLPVALRADDSAETRFLDGIRAAACKQFRTVLGPGSNEAHANHLHFDQRQRSHDYRLCELRQPATSPAKNANVTP